jgi:CHAD domain-containing protein
MKWIKKVRVQDPVATAARRSLVARVRTLRKFLLRAAEHAEEDTEFVHQLRVASRRASAALQLYEEVPKKKQFRWWRKALRRVRHAASAARECDVLAAQFTRLPPDRPVRPWILDRLRVERIRSQWPIAALARRWRSERTLQKHLKKLRRHLRQVARREPVERFGDWAPRQLAAFIEQFFAVVPTKENDSLEALHAFRISGKHLRYAVELLASAFGPTLR